ncbi:MAG: arsenate reductase ArsC [Bacteroidota bacterium]
MKNVLVLCTGNSCRSQMVHGYLQKYTGDKAKIYSAGVEVHGVNPIAVGVMNEDGVDISKHTSNNVDEYAEVNFDVVLTVCDNAKERCPVFPTTAEKIHHNFTDPAAASGTVKEILKEFREVREQIKEFSSDFAEKHL